MPPQRLKRPIDPSPFRPAGITSRNDDAHASSVASIEPPAIAAPMIPESWGQRGKTSSKPQL
jgi:hypothetical protein